MEFVNSDITSRKRLLQRAIYLLCGVLIIFCIKYLLSPEDYQTGAKSSKGTMSLTGLIVMGSLATIAYACMVVSARLVLRLAIDQQNNSMIITFIERFRLKPRTLSVALSDTQIQIHKETHDKKEYTMLFLIHPEFGNMRISEMDFGADVQQIITLFSDMQQVTAAKMRKQRLLKRAAKRGIR